MDPLGKLLDYLTEKSIETINNAFLKHSPPTINLNKVTDINFEVLKKLKSEYGIGGLILDVDETLRKDFDDIPKCNKEWLEYMKKEFKVCIVSSGFDGKIKEVIERMDIKYDGLHFISKRKSFKQAAEEMGLEPENILVIGNDAIKDIYTGNKCGMITAIVNEVVEEKDEIKKKDEMER